MILVLEQIDQTPKRRAMADRAKTNPALRPDLAECDQDGPGTTSCIEGRKAFGGIAVVSKVYQQRLKHFSSFLY